PETRPDTAVAVPWLVSDVGSMVLQAAGDSLSPTALSLVDRTAMDLLVNWVANPNTRHREQLARWLPWLVAPAATQYTVPTQAQLQQLTLHVAEGGAVDRGVVYGGFWTAGAMSVGPRALTGCEQGIAVVLDDRDEALGDDHRQAWREWLRLANLLNFRSTPTAITTRSLVASDVSTAADTEAETARTAATGRASLPQEWVEAWDEAAEGVERSLVQQLADQGVPAPAVG